MADAEPQPGGAGLPGSVAGCREARGCRAVSRPPGGYGSGRTRNQPALSLSRIVAAAVRVADTEGLDAVSMGRVAAELGNAPMSLYRHVSSKEELVTLMVDAAWDEARGRRPGRGWRAGLCRWAGRCGPERGGTVGDAHRAQQPADHAQPGGLVRDALACLADAELTEARKASVIMLLAGCMRNLATTEADIAAAIRASGLAPSSE